MLRYAITIPVLISAVVLASGARAAEKNKKLKIGDVGPVWTALTGTDDKSHSLGDYKDAKALVIVFTCNHCPVAKAYQKRLIALQNDYQDKGVQIVAICVNKGDADNLEAMKKRAIEAGFNFPYLYDETQKSGKDYGASLHAARLRAGSRSQTGLHGRDRRQLEEGRRREEAVSPRRAERNRGWQAAGEDQHHAGRLQHQV